MNNYLINILDRKRQLGLASVEMVLIMPLLLMLMFIMVQSAKTMVVFEQRTIESRNGAYAVELYNGGEPTLLDELRQTADETVQDVERELAELEENPVLGYLGLTPSAFIDADVLSIIRKFPIQRYATVADDNQWFYDSMLESLGANEFQDAYENDDRDIMTTEIRTLFGVLDQGYFKSGSTVGVSVSAYFGPLGVLQPFDGRFFMRHYHVADFAKVLDLNDIQTDNGAENTPDGFVLKEGYSKQMEAMLAPEHIFTKLFADGAPEPLETPPVFDLPFPPPVDPTVGIVQRQSIDDRFAEYQANGGTDPFDEWWTSVAHDNYSPDELHDYAESVGWEVPPGSGLWLWPPNEGFVLGSQRPDTLYASGTDGSINIDRYTRRSENRVPASDRGSFVSPAGANFPGRALPANQGDYNVHEFEVLRDLNVISGPAAPWFGQQGGELQYKLSNEIRNLVNSDPPSLQVIP